jgi:hypothetical protein
MAGGFPATFHSQRIYVYLTKLKLDVSEHGVCSNKSWGSSRTYEHVFMRYLVLGYIVNPKTQWFIIIWFFCWKLPYMGYRYSISPWIYCRFFLRSLGLIVQADPQTSFNELNQAEPMIGSSIQGNPPDVLLKLCKNHRFLLRFPTHFFP